MAGEFVIEALEPRQLLSCSAAPADAPTVSAAVMVNAASSSATITALATATATVSTASSASTAPSSAATATATVTTSTAALVHAGSSGDDENDAPPPGSKFPWGADIYPPPEFNNTGTGTPRTTGSSTPTSATASSSSTTTTSSTATTSTSVTPPPTSVILIGGHHGKTSVARHFSVRPDIDESRPAHGSSSADSVAPPTNTPPANAPPVITPPAIARPGVQPQHFPAGTFAGVASSPGLTAAKAATFTALAGNSTTDGAYISPIDAAAIPHVGAHAAPAVAPPSASAAPIVTAPSGNAAERAMRLIPRPDLSGLLLPLATMDTLAVGNAGPAVNKWEVDVALGSLTVVAAGYYYLADAAARRRRQRALAVSVFCDKPVE